MLAAEIAKGKMVNTVYRRRHQAWRHRPSMCRHGPPAWSAHRRSALGLRCQFTRSP